MLLLFIIFLQPSSASEVETDNRDCVDDANADAKNKIASIDDQFPISRKNCEPDVEKTESEKKITSIGELFPISRINCEPDVEKPEHSKKMARIDELAPITRIKWEPDEPIVEKTEYNDTDQNQPTVDVQIQTEIGKIQSADEDFSDLDSIFDSPREAMIRKELRRKTELQVKHNRLIKSLRKKNARLQKRNDVYKLLINNLSKYIDELQKK